METIRRYACVSNGITIIVRTDEINSTHVSKAVFRGISRIFVNKFVGKAIPTRRAYVRRYGFVDIWMVKLFYIFFPRISKNDRLSLKTSYPEKVITVFHAGKTFRRFSMPEKCEFRKKKILNATAVL